MGVLRELDPHTIQLIRKERPTRLPDAVLTLALEGWPDRQDPVLRTLGSEFQARLERGSLGCLEWVYFTTYRLFRDSDERLGSFVDFIEPSLRIYAPNNGHAAMSMLAGVILSKAAYLNFVGDTEAAHTAYVEGLTIMARLINEGHDQYLGRYRAMLPEVPPDVPSIVDLNLMCEAWEIAPTNEPEVEAALRRFQPPPGAALH